MEMQTGYSPKARIFHLAATSRAGTALRLKCEPCGIRRAVLRDLSLRHKTKKPTHFLRDSEPTCCAIFLLSFTFCYAQRPSRKRGNIKILRDNSASLRDSRQGLSGWRECEPRAFSARFRALSLRQRTKKTDPFGSVRSLAER